MAKKFNLDRFHLRMRVYKIVKGKHCLDQFEAIFNWVKEYDDQVEGKLFCIEESRDLDEAKFLFNMLK